MHRSAPAPARAPQNAKELSESFACFNAARVHLAETFLPSDPHVTLLAIGDGLTPRTAALFAFRTAWRSSSSAGSTST